MAAVNTRIESDQNRAAFYDMCDQFRVEGAVLIALCQTKKYFAGLALGTDSQPFPKRPNRAGIFMFAMRDRDVTALGFLILFLADDRENHAFIGEFQIVERQRRNRRTPQSRRETHQQDGPVANRRGRAVLNQQVGNLTQFVDLKRPSASRPLGALPLSAPQELYRVESPGSSIPAS